MSAKKPAQKPRSGPAPRPKTTARLATELFYETQIAELKAAHAMDIEALRTSLRHQGYAHDKDQNKNSINDRIILSLARQLAEANDQVDDLRNTVDDLIFKNEEYRVRNQISKQQAARS